MGHLNAAERVLSANMSTNNGSCCSTIPTTSSGVSSDDDAASTSSSCSNIASNNKLLKRNNAHHNLSQYHASPSSSSSSSTSSSPAPSSPLRKKSQTLAGTDKQKMQQKQDPPHSEYTYNTNLDEYTRNFKGDKVLWWQFKAPLKWDKVIQISLLHLVCFVCFLFYPLRQLNIYTTIWSFFTGGVAGFGVTAGAHRYWTHRSYKANIPLRVILMMSFSLAGQNTLYDWVRDHRVHHKYSETDADPHNSNRGFFFAHVGWLMMLKHPEVLRRGRQIDMSDVLADPVVQFHQKYFIPLKMLLCFIIPTLIPIYCWGEDWHLAFIQQCIFRYVSSLNFTWLVNSAAHMWGTRPYDKRIMPVENIYVSILAMGEGWHNYHHVFPWDYKAAELGKYSVNFSTMVLDLFHKMGWAWNMKEPSKELVRRTIEKYGDGSHDVSQLLAADSDHGGHCHYPEVPDPEFAEEDEAESSSTESTKLDENENHKNKKLTT